MSKVLRAMIHVSDIKYWAEVNIVYSKYFGEHKPARGVIPCKILHNNYQVAMDVIAAI